jgi:hypothetical protein
MISKQGLLLTAAGAFTGGICAALVWCVGVPRRVAKEAATANDTRLTALGDVAPAHVPPPSSSTTGRDLRIAHPREWPTWVPSLDTNGTVTNLYISNYTGTLQWGTNFYQATRNGPALITGEQP